MSQKQPIISVFGSSAPPAGSADYEAARTLGRLLAEAGFTVQTGGYGGIMAGTSQGASEVGGQVIGVTSGQMERFRPGAANQWVQEEIKCQSQQERLLHLVTHCQGAIVMPGGIGTLSELALIWSLVQVGELPRRPIITVGGLWQRTLAAFIDDDYIKPIHRALITTALSPGEAVDVLADQLAGKGQ
jgi:hypothetical protein